MGDANITIMKRKKVCIICSLSCEEECKKVIHCFEEMGMDVHHPFINQNGSLYGIQKAYLEAIEASDVVVAIPKVSLTDEHPTTFGPRTRIMSDFGESTSYEMAIARHMGKPVIIWGEGENI